MSGGRILVVDDSHTVLKVVDGVLAKAGYTTLCLDNGHNVVDEAVRFKPDLVLVDFAMPGINGAEVAVAVRQKHPGLPILFVSGYSDSAALQSAVGDTMLLRKPFRPVELAAAVRSVLEAAMRPA